eukprot:scaffold388_cov380-Prasinococcus_capsulatus_cf.AAC.32
MVMMSPRWRRDRGRRSRQSPNLARVAKSAARPMSDVAGPRRNREQRRRSFVRASNPPPRRRARASPARLDLALATQAGLRVAELWGSCTRSTVVLCPGCDPATSC